MTPLQRIRVPLGFAYGLFFLWLAQPRPGWFYVGTALAAAGLVVRLWASGHLEKGRTLAVSGPYRWTRNPLYLGSFVLGVGLSVASANPWLMAVFPPLFLSVYIPVMRREEAEMAAGFGEDFSFYRRRVPMLFPRPPVREAVETASQGAQPGLFRWKRVFLNREYNAVIGFVVVALLIWCKMRWS
jgi:protein-S-isoprenylcysteine O-methyltransferase Ste14